MRRHIAIPMEIKHALATRTERCHPDCRGYVYDHDSDSVATCDECAALNHYRLYDADLEHVPEVQRALKEWRAAVDE